jgi:hypothetical protein
MTTDNDGTKNALDRITEELKAFKKANDAIEEIYKNSKETEKKKERQFQVRMLEIQLRHDSITSSLTAIIAVALAVLVLSLTVINSSDILVETKQIVSSYIIPLFVGMVIAFGALLVISFVEIQYREVKNLKNEFDANKNP